MKNRFVFLLCLALAFLSCDKNDDLIVRQDDSLVLFRPGDKDGGTLSAVHSLGRDTCIDLTTVQWLYGTTVVQPIHEMAQQETETKNLPSERFVLEASGDAMSEHLARGFSELKLIYRNDPHRMAGELVTRFYYGEVLELKFEEVSDLQYEGQMLHVEVNVKEAVLRTGTQLYILDGGVVRFSIPRHPESPLSLTVELNIRICLQ